MGHEFYADPGFRDVAQGNSERKSTLSQGSLFKDAILHTSQAQPGKKPLSNSAISFNRNVSLLILGCALTLVSCRQSDEISQVTQVPTVAAEPSRILTQSRAGTFALRARVSYVDIESLAAEQLPASYPVEGSRRVCRKIIGIEACGTANWNLTFDRPGKLHVRGHEQIVYLSTPISFDGIVGVEGRVARALGLSSLDVSGEARVFIALSLQMGENWCPVIHADVSYQWTTPPTLVYPGGLDFTLESVVNDALDKQLATLQPRLNESIDCITFKKQLNEHWRSYTFALDIPAGKQDENAQQLHLNIVPSDFAFSGLQTEDASLGVSFALGATTVVESEPQPVQDLALPALRQVPFEDSRTDFELILRASYTQLEQLIRPRLIDKTYSTKSAAGEASVTITSFQLSGNAQDVTVALGFTAKLPGSRKPANGIVYLQATPTMNAATETMILENIRLSRVLDSTLWNLVSLVFEGQIITQLERYSKMDLGPRLRALEQNLTAQLHDPARTAGVNVSVSGLSVNILEIVAESQALAARARVSTELDIEIPLSAISKPSK